MTQIKVDKQTLEHFKHFLEQQASYMEGQMGDQDVDINTTIMDGMKPPIIISL